MIHVERHSRVLLATEKAQMRMSSSQPYERFVPQGRASLVEDAPGWGKETHETETNTSGPACWKCRGSGAVKPKKTKGTDEQPKNSECPVCGGRGRLTTKRKEAMGATKPGIITRGRRCPDGWVPSGPAPHALTEKTKWSKYVEKANQGSDVQIETEELLSDAPNWMPQLSEELCNLVGTWRILQRVGSHRWTTDDLVTAYVASREVQSRQAVKYLDLGTGNASVLQMVAWALLKDNRTVDATGVEARLEAVNLARRSLSFNLGKDSPAACIVHGDFRDISFSHQFDLVTGTPPYFRVDFAVNATEDAVVSAIINQGGMPTARQSAPARCEFRGGIEAYCDAASRALRPQTGRFVVCENWLNHNRVVAAAEQYRLCILSQVEVEGRQGRGTLFCVYVMKGKEDDLPTETKRENLAVRDCKGYWTNDYRQSVLNEMSIPDPASCLLPNSEK